MRWDRFFDDLEDQLAAEWEAERAALESEAERLRLARVDLRTRLGGLVRDAEGGVLLELADGAVVEGRPAAVGADWVAVPDAGGRRLSLIPLAAILAIRCSHGDLLRSARPSEGADRLAARVTFALALRDLARRRVGVTIGLTGGTRVEDTTRVLAGTIDRVGADHLDLALHDAGSPRRAAEVRGYRLLPLGGVAWVRIDASAGVPVL
ncbi:hypothetical protein [Microbacterium marinilacus]|uniref:hypothetical protein n=1 Tax=Microbacterium marinilacus TaxID=415209 RepID=UPI001C8D61FD|nr:hypothetical protein [Microbacterium marinilacus]MBY0687249.1 hypothetical protein [Microbacterium marinilacus]